MSISLTLLRVSFVGADLEKRLLDIEGFSVRRKVTIQSTEQSVTRRHKSRKHSGWIKAVLESLRFLKTRLLTIMK